MTTTLPLRLWDGLTASNIEAELLLNETENGACEGLAQLTANGARSQCRVTGQYTREADGPHYVLHLARNGILFSPTRINLHPGGGGYECGTRIGPVSFHAHNT